MPHKRSWSWFGGLALAAWTAVLAAPALADPSVTVTRSDGSAVHGVLTGFKDGKLTVRSDAGETVLDAAQVKEVEFASAAAAATSPAEVGSPGPPADDSAKLARLERDLLWHRDAEDTLAVARRLAGSTDKALLDKLMARLRHEVVGRDTARFQRMQCLSALTCLRVYLDPIERLPELKQEIERWPERPLFREHPRRDNVRKLTEAIDQRLREAAAKSSAGPAGKEGQP
jgi:hypothetical protein